MNLFSDRAGLKLWLLCLTIVAGISALFVIQIHSQYVGTISDAEHATQSLSAGIARCKRRRGDTGKQREQRPHFNSQARLMPDGSSSTRGAPFFGVRDES